MFNHLPYLTFVVPENTEATYACIMSSGVAKTTVTEINHKLFHKYDTNRLSAVLLHAMSLVQQADTPLVTGFPATASASYKTCCFGVFFIRPRSLNHFDHKALLWITPVPAN